MGTKPELRAQPHPYLHSHCPLRKQLGHSRLYTLGASTSGTDHSRYCLGNHGIYGSGPAWIEESRLRKMRRQSQAWGTVCRDVSGFRHPTPGQPRCPAHRMVPVLRDAAAVPLLPGCPHYPLSRFYLLTWLYALFTLLTCGATADPHTCFWRHSRDR